MLHHQPLRPQSASPLITFAFVAMLFFLPWFTAAAVRAADMTPTRVLELVNADRATEGVAPLELNDTLSAAAEAKLADMFANNYFAHTSPYGETPWRWFQMAGYSYQYAGENLAIHYANPEGQHAAWMASPTHRANILSDKYRETGIAVQSGLMNGETVTMTVQLFGAPRAVNAVPTPKTVQVSVHPQGMATGPSRPVVHESVASLAYQPSFAVNGLTSIAAVVLTLVLLVGPSLFLLRAGRALLFTLPMTYR